MIKCPYCAALIGPHARKCKYCKESLVDAAYERRMADLEALTTQPPGQALIPDFRGAWGKLHGDYLADNLPKNTIKKYQRTYCRLFIDFRRERFPHIENLYQLNLQFFREYKNYTAGTISYPGGWRTELIAIKSIMTRLYLLGCCDRKIIEDLKYLRKPQQIKRQYFDVSKEKMAELFSFIKKDRPDYYPYLYYMLKTGRRSHETSVIRKTDVVLEGGRPVRINISLKTTKNKKEAPLMYIDEGLEKVLSQALKSKSEWLFPNRLGRKCVNETVGVYFKKISRNIVGVELTLHYLRHRFVTECAKARVPIEDVKAISGIRATTILLDRYSHSTAEGQASVLAVTGL